MREIHVGSVTSVRTRCFPGSITPHWNVALVFKEKVHFLLQRGSSMQANHFIWRSVASTAIVSNTGGEIGNAGLTERWCGVSGCRTAPSSGTSSSHIFQIILMILNFCHSCNNTYDFTVFYNEGGAYGGLKESSRGHKLLHDTARARIRILSPWILARALSKRCASSLTRVPDNGPTCMHLLIIQWLSMS